MIPSSWFTESDRRSMINFLIGKIDEEVNHMVQTPTSDNIGYQTAVSRANIAWYKALLHVADPSKYKLNPIGSRVKEPLTARQYDEWRKATVDKFTNSAPNPDPVTATFIHQLINNGVNYHVK